MWGRIVTSSRPIETLIIFHFLGMALERVSGADFSIHRTTFQTGSVCEGPGARGPHILGLVRKLCYVPSAQLAHLYSFPGRTIVTDCASVVKTISKGGQVRVPVAEAYGRGLERYSALEVQGG